MLQQLGEEYVSCTDLACYMNIDLIVARKDIAMTGLAGHRRYGYRVNELIDAIRHYVGWDKPVSAVLVGAGALGSALLGYDDFSHYNLAFEYVFDADPCKIGTNIHGHVVRDIADIRSVLEPAPPRVGVICVSAAAAQPVADALCDLGIRYLWNFANVCLNVPSGVIVQREVIAGGFAVLAAKIKNLESGCGLEEE
jgi:redox-sensing transcriptional repressor